MLRNIILFFKPMANKLDIEPRYTSKQIMPDSQNIQELEKQTKEKEFKMRAIDLIESIFVCKVHDLHLDGISSVKDDPYNLINETTGEIIRYYCNGTCRYYDLHAFNSEHDVVIAIYRD